jgi:hypothetical protein
VKDNKRSPSPPADKRRFDSLAVLFQGDAVCGASCFDGEQLLLANNHGIETELVKKVIVYLQTIAIMCHGGEHQYSVIKGQLMSYAHRTIGLIQKNTTYETRFQAALDKVTHSLRCAYHNPQDPGAFTLEMAEAIRNGKIFFIKKGRKSNSKRSLHAEMQIIDHLYNDPRKILNSGEPIYLGVSKKCCINCETAIRSVNNVKKSNIVDIRGEGHGFCFSADIPPFLRGDVKIKSEFLRLRGIVKIEEVFSIGDKGRILGGDQLHTPSSSVCESSSAQDESESSTSVTEAAPEKKGQAIGNPSRPTPNKPKFIPQQKIKITNTVNTKNKLQKNQSKDKISAGDSPAAFFSKKGKSPKKSSAPRKKNAMKRPNTSQSKSPSLPKA